MRGGFVVALGEETTVEVPASRDETIEATTPLRLTPLSSRARNTLARCQVRTAGELLALSPAQVRALHAIGTKAAQEVIAFQERLRAQGLAPTPAASWQVEPALVDDLRDSPEPVDKLPLTQKLREALARAELPTVGSVAALTR